MRTESSLVTMAEAVRVVSSGPLSSTSIQQSEHTTHVTID